MNRAEKKYPLNLNPLSSLISILTVDAFSLSSSLVESNLLRFD